MEVHEVTLGPKGQEEAPDQTPAPDQQSIFAAVKAIQKPAWAAHLVVQLNLTGEVTDAMADNMEALLAALQDPRFEGVVITIDSPGGSVDAGYRIIRAIEASHTPITCVADNIAASMGFYILQACPERVVTKRASLMVHEQHGITGGIIISRESLRKMLEVHEIIARGLAEMAIRRMHLTLAEFQAKVKEKDWWMAWEEAKTVGAVDLVVDSPADVLKSLQSDLTLPASK